MSITLLTSDWHAPITLREVRMPGDCSDYLLDTLLSRKHYFCRFEQLRQVQRDGFPAVGRLLYTARYWLISKPRHPLDPRKVPFPVDH